MFHFKNLMCIVSGVLFWSFFFKHSPYSWASISDRPNFQKTELPNYRTFERKGSVRPNRTTEPFINVINVFPAKCKAILRKKKFPEILGPSSTNFFYLALDADFPGKHNIIYVSLPYQKSRLICTI